MITPPTNWDTLWADSNSILEVQITIQFTSSVSKVLTNSDLSSCSLEGSLFDDVSLGNVCSARLRFVINDAAGYFSVFAQGQKVVFKCRLKNDSVTTSYVNQGIYYVDSFERNKDGKVEIIAYDELYKSADYVSQLTSDVNFIDYCSRISSMYGMTMSRQLYTTRIADATNITTSTASNQYVQNIKIKSTSGYTRMRDVLSTVASLAGGNIALDKSNRMQLYRLGAGQSITSSPVGIPVTASSIYYDEESQVITGVDLSDGQNTYQSATGWRIAAQIDGDVTIAASQAVAKTVRNNMRTEINDVSSSAIDDIRVSNVRVDGALVNPLFELGDTISVDIGGGKYYNFMLCNYSVSYLGGCWGYLGYPKSDTSVNYSIVGEWSSAGWFGRWTGLRLHNGYQQPDVVFLNKFMFALKDVNFNQIYARSNLVAIHSVSGLNTLTVSLQYYGSGGATKTINVTGYLAEDVYPPERSWYGSNNCKISYIKFYCASIPDDAIGKTAIGHPVALRNDSQQAGIDVVFSYQEA